MITSREQRAMMTRLTLFRIVFLLCLPLLYAAGQEPTPSIRGMVTDSIRHAPLAGATVVATRVPGRDSTKDYRDYTAMTDGRGRFAINGLPPETYVITVEHPWLDSTGLGVPARTVDLRVAQTASVNLAVPSGATIRATFCPLSARDSTLGLVAGYVKDAHSGHPVAGARVVFAWGDFNVDERTARAQTIRRTAAAVTGRDGTFRICGLPVLRTILVQAQVGAHEATGAVEAEIPTSGVLVETLRIDASPTGTTALTGEIQREGTQRPLAGAHVHLFGGNDEVVTTANGLFRLNDVPMGTQSIEVTALGFYPRRYALDVRPGNMGKVTITLLETATVLDSIRITGRASLHREFDERSVHGAGQYLNEAMIEKANVLETAELMQQVHGFYVMMDTVYSSRGLTEIGSNTNRVCQPTLFIDGMRGAGTMNDIPPSAIHGIEIYASSTNVPPQYRTSSCGAILIWTK